MNFGHFVIISFVLLNMYLGILSPVVQAQEPPYDFRVFPVIHASGFFAENSVRGGLAQTAILIPMNSNQSFLVGPRVGGQWTSQTSQNRFEIQWGGEGTLWMMNAFGLGFGVDWMPHSDQSHMQFNPSLSTRLLHFQEHGAWSARLGLIYDTQYHWGAQLGISLQFGGVPNVGTSPSFF